MQNTKTNLIMLPIRSVIYTFITYVLNPSIAIQAFFRQCDKKSLYHTRVWYRKWNYFLCVFTGIPRISSTH